MRPEDILHYVEGWCEKCAKATIHAVSHFEKGKIHCTVCKDTTGADGDFIRRDFIPPSQTCMDGAKESLSIGETPEGEILSKQLPD